MSEVYIESAFTGLYEPSDPKIIEPIKTITAFDFGTGGGNRLSSVNRIIAEHVLDELYIDKQGKPRTILAQELTAAALHALYGSNNVHVEPIKLHPTSSGRSGIFGTGLSAYAALEEMRDIMAELDLPLEAIVAAQSYMVDRTVRHGEILGVSLVKPPGLPKDFDRWSFGQPWCLDERIWRKREDLGQRLLRQQGKI
ncbi:hypothetical protein FWG95_00925 [Candidatus Saccharibacteria bacterium]|nr:hypothetical protein [Candidatus Saccharibacteria bacterium]